MTLAIEDLSGLPEAEREARAVRFIREEAQRPFDLARGPLIRAGLLRLGEQEHIAIVTMHHAISDGWSIGILIREVSALYESFREGESSPLPELAIQYADYAVWQRNWLQGACPRLAARLLDETARGLARSRTAHGPTSATRSQPSAAASGRQSCRRRLSKRCEHSADSEGATLYMTLLAAFQVLLHRYSGQEDFAVGSPIAGRTRPELEGLIGCFVNTLVMRADLSGDPGFRELLGRVRRRRSRRTAIRIFLSRSGGGIRIPIETRAARRSSR